MLTGTVKWFDATKGYGFIKPDNGAVDVFVHASELVACDDLQKGQKVTFRLGAHRGRPHAVHVAPASAAAQ